jgi:hypothetical protein
LQLTREAVAVDDTQIPGPFDVENKTLFLDFGETVSSRSYCLSQIAYFSTFEPLDWRKIANLKSYVMISHNFTARKL